MKIDLLAICGMPRAGTTFLHDLFAYNKVSDRFFALHSHSGKGFAANPMSTCEPRYINVHFRAGEPITHAIRFLVEFWRDQIDNHDITIVYKHPQLIFHGPIDEDRLFRVKYIFCKREFISWRKSFLDMTDGESIVEINTDSVYRKYWGQEWNIPPGLAARAEHFYVRMEYYINEFKAKLRENQYYDFTFEDPVKSLENIFVGLDIKANPLQLVKWNWRTKDI